MNNNNDMNLDGLDEFVEDVDDGQPGLADAPRVVPLVNGGVLDNVAWTGGSRNPDLPLNYPKTPYCSHGVKIDFKVCSRCDKGVKEDWKFKLKMTMQLSTCEPQFRSGLEQVGVDSPFWIYENARWIHLFEQPDAVPLAVIRRHEQELAHDCQYDQTNLHLGRLFLKNSINVDLHKKNDVSVLAE